MASDFRRDEPAHLAVLERLREELAKFRVQGRISQEFVDWHQRLMACIAIISQNFPGCADLCVQLKAIDFEISPEFAGTTEKLSDDPQAAASISKSFFGYRCSEADEILAT